MNIFANSENCCLVNEAHIVVAIQSFCEGESTNVHFDNLTVNFHYCRYVFQDLLIRIIPYTLKYPSENLNQYSQRKKYRNFEQSICQLTVCWL